MKKKLFDQNSLDLSRKEKLIIFNEHKLRFDALIGPESKVS